MSKLFPYRTQTVSLSMGDIVYTDEGGGIPLVLLHGAPMTSFGFKRMIEALRGGFRVIVPDLPGFGKSTVREGFDETLGSYSRFVREFCTTLNLDRFYLLVFDSSGSFGLHAATHMPDRIAGLIIADSVAFPLTGRVALVKWMLYLVASPFMRRLNGRLNLLPWLVSTVAPWTHPLSRDERHYFQSQFGSRDKRDRILRMFRQMATEQDFFRELVPRIESELKHLPTLLLFGQFDPIRFVGAPARYRRMLPRAVLRYVPFEEHFPILSSASRVADEIRAWSRRYGASRPVTDEMPVGRLTVCVSAAQHDADPDSALQSERRGPLRPRRQQQTLVRTQTLSCDQP